MITVLTLSLWGQTSSFREKFKPFKLIETDAVIWDDINEYTLSHKAGENRIKYIITRLNERAISASLIYDRLTAAMHHSKHE